MWSTHINEIDEKTVISMKKSIKMQVDFTGKTVLEILTSQTKIVQNVIMFKKNGMRRQTRECYLQVYTH